MSDKCILLICSESMNEKLRSIFHSKKGKVFQYKQQLLNRFSSDHVPVQYGVDYSSKIKPYKTETEIIDNITEREPPATNFGSQLSPLTRQRKEKTFETVSKIQFQKSPAGNRKVIQISSKSNPISTTTSDIKVIPEVSSSGSTNIPISVRPTNLSESATNTLNTDVPVNDYISNPTLSPVSEPEIVSQNLSREKGKKLREKFFSTNKPVSTDRHCVKTMTSDPIDPTLVSVAQRAKFLMSTKKIQPPNRQVSVIPIDMQPEKEDESVLSIQDRIKLFKTNISTSSERPQKHASNRFKTQPLSFDDIARANAMILDQCEVSSTIASPSLTNSNETLVDFSESSNSSSSKISDAHKPSLENKKSSSVLRAQSFLINQKQNIYKTADDEFVPTIKVKDFIKNCDKKEELPAQNLPKNAAVSRKLAFKSKTEKEEKNIRPRKPYCEKSHLTQPITKIDIEKSVMSSNGSTESIKDRISKIKIQGETWKTRINKELDTNAKERPGSMVIASLQEQLQVNNEKWKDRIEQKDVEEFTTSNRLNRSMRQNKITKRYTIHVPTSKDDAFVDSIIVRLRRGSEKDAPPRKFSLISDITIDDTKCASNLDVSRKSDSISSFDSPSVIQSRKVTISQNSDQSLSNFFHSSSVSGSDISTSSTNLPTNDDFDEIFMQADLSLAINKRSVKPTRRQKLASRNPLKTLNESNLTKIEYDEVITGVAERELKRNQWENVQLKSGFLEEALAGLATKEDFSKIKLKRTESNNSFEQFVSPYKDLMLISVKGRKTVQVRLVEPNSSSINLGDCYLLLTKQQVFVWIGECANVIETNKVNELGSWIAKVKELNYGGISDKPIVIKSVDCDLSANELQFWKCLHYNDVPKINPPGDVSEDEIYEQMIQRTNMVFKVQGNKLVPWDEYWGMPLKHKMLAEDHVLIFDFGTELYLWSGSKADKALRSHGRNLLKKVFSKGYDYEECSINPFDPLPNSVKETKAKKGNVRPNWIIVGRLGQKGETTLFKEKFNDWPESSRLIKCVGHIELGKTPAGDLTPVNLENLFNTTHPSVHTTIDGKSVGRGGKWKVLDDGIYREFCVTTKSVNMWNIIENEAKEMKSSNMGQFFSGNSYIIRWDYELKTLGRYEKTDKSGNVSSVFFFWQGSATSIVEKTASALLTINLDTDRVTQIRVKENHESPAFCRLFDGSMVIYSGKQRSSNLISNKRLFLLRGELEGEAHFIEIPCQSQSLRSRSIFLLLTILKRRGFLWFGNLVSENIKSCARYCLKRLVERKPVDFCSNINDVKFEEISQGNEPRTFWEDMGIVKKWKSSLTSNSLEPIRGWHASALTGTFTMSEMLYSLHPDDNNDKKFIVPVFPLLQSAMYKTNQPALFLIYLTSHIYIWEGWWCQSQTKSINISVGTSTVTMTKTATVPNENFCDDNADNGKKEDFMLAKNRFAAEKLALLKSVHSWLTETGRSHVTASIVYAGLEPPCFQELFPFWEVNEEARRMNIKRDRKMFQEDDVSEILQKYLSMKYSVEILRQEILPENVIPSRIESYLTDQSFEELFKMTKEDFYDLSPWKQLEKKKEVNLF